MNNIYNYIKLSNIILTNKYTYSVIKCSFCKQLSSELMIFCSIQLSVLIVFGKLEWLMKFQKNIYKPLMDSINFENLFKSWKIVNFCCKFWMQILRGVNFTKFDEIYSEMINFYFPDGKMFTKMIKFELNSCWNLSSRKKFDPLSKANLNLKNQLQIFPLNLKVKSILYRHDKSNDSK